MTFKAMGCDPTETARRVGVCERLNILWTKRERAEDPKQVKAIDHKIEVIKRTERPWMKDVCFFLY